MNEEKMKILNMVADGTLNPDDAALLLDKLNEKAITKKGIGTLPEYLYVQVDSDDDSGEKVNIKIPIKLLRSGINLITMLPDSVQGEVSNAMKKEGINFNLEDINPDNLDEFLTALQDLEINVDSKSDHKKIKVYCE